MAGAISENANEFFRGEHPFAEGLCAKSPRTCDGVRHRDRGLGACSSWSTPRRSTDCENSGGRLLPSCQGGWRVTSSRAPAFFGMPDLQYVVWP